ncbi:CcmD family protein [Aquibacillus sp. 3ASR75-11]|uniref:CcmD family protein n=1 Tax=Terrihalobacillus insolitus TaxID=2950438 RepID=A0A9X4ANF5_9BACI|nr:CcmD family protein [Terrihalobacillus insolitus]MDC3414554.1 CcmD family protein [Terrihalobacillus insolitus]MDC3425769.1 CcmD family protein [Terrihalobacillus insolitus]
MTYLFIGVSVMWIGILVYMGRLFQQQKQVSQQLDNMKNEARQ